MTKIDTPRGTSKKILIVEDDEDFICIIREKFLGEGFPVVTAGNGEEGLEMLKEEKPDLILLDIMMPIMDGMEMAKRMKEAKIGIPVIFLTNMGDVDHMSKAMEIIPSDYIIKADVPIDKIVAQVKKKLGIV